MIFLLCSLDGGRLVWMGGSLDEKPCFEDVADGDPVVELNELLSQRPLEEQELLLQIVRAMFFEGTCEQPYED